VAQRGSGSAFGFRRHQFVTTRPGRKFFQRTSAPDIGVPFGLSKLHGFTVAHWRASKRRLLGRVRSGKPPGKLPNRCASKKAFSNKDDTSTPDIMAKVVSRLEMDSRWALARSVSGLVAERDGLKEKLDTGQTDAPQ